MNDQAETPETDKALFDVQRGCDSFSFPEHARRMERERDEWKALVTQYSAEREHNAMQALAYKAERDELKTLLTMDRGVVTIARNGYVQELERQRDEARRQLAEIEDKVREELGGHPDSELWGEAGLIAATMRCVDALGEVTDQRDEARADAIRWQSIAEGRGRTDETLTNQ